MINWADAATLLFSSIEFPPTGPAPANVQEAELIGAATVCAADATHAVIEVSAC